MNATKSDTVLTMRPLAGESDLRTAWNSVDVLTLPDFANKKYTAGFASSDRCVDEALRLRYEVFNLELGEGLAASALCGLDRDEFDGQMTHLILLENSTGRVVGTYRIQTASRAMTGRGLYSAQFFDVEGLTPFLPKTIELGRACLALEHRSLAAILTLWMGLGEFMNLYDQQFLFGCCSLTTQDPDDGWRAMKTIRARDYLHPEIFLPVRPGRDCGPASREFDADLGDAIPLPKLFRTYMRLCAKVISAPAIDRDFGTVDFLVMMDGKEVNLSQLDILK